MQIKYFLWCLPQIQKPHKSYLINCWLDLCKWVKLGNMIHLK